MVSTFYSQGFLLLLAGTLKELSRIVSAHHQFFLALGISHICEVSPPAWYTQELGAHGCLRAISLLDQAQIAPNFRLGPHPYPWTMLLFRSAQ